MREWRELARKVEDLGYSTLTMADHFTDQMAPGPALAAAAAVTTELRIGTLVYCNDYRHPVVLAKEVATLDLLSDGRFEFGLGAGWMTTDYEETGIELARPGIRIDRMIESLSICRSLLAGDQVTHDGVHYSINRHTAEPVATQQPMPPLLIGGGGKRVLSIAGREADIVGINVNLASGTIGPEAGANATLEHTDEKLQWVRAAAGDRYDDVEVQVRVHVASVTTNRNDFTDAIAGGLGLSRDQALASPHLLAGTVDEICDELLARRDRWDMSYIGLGVESIDEMVPVVAKLAGT